MTLRLDPIWRTDAAVVAVFAALGAPERDVRAVGGCVRDAVLDRDRPDAEIDIGTPDPPDIVLKRLATAGLRAIPTGLAHGTITALVDSRGFEITSLRRDTACDGRHADVEFTKNWQEDARRRDFTFNAMSMSPDGTVYDDFGGIDDARAGRVRFVGAPADRIKEDYLRILRLFRFRALYGREPIDEATLAACTAHKAGLAQLSGERIQAEMAKLLAAEDPTGAIAQMRVCSVLAVLFPGAAGGQVLQQLIAVERAAEISDRFWLRRLAALLTRQAAQFAVERLKLSNADRAMLEALLGLRAALTPQSSQLDRDRALFAVGPATMRDRVLLAWAWQPSLDAPIASGEWRALLADVAQWQHRPLPVTGADVLDLGVAPGPAVGALLAEMTDWWIAARFVPSRDLVLAELRRRIASKR